MFHPVTGRRVQGRDDQVKSEGGISNYLYKKHRMKESAQRMQKELYDKVEKDTIKQEKELTRNKTSEMILEHKIRIQLDALYHAFDADGNGYISADEINLDHVSAKLLEIFTPLFVEMENLGESLSKADFAESAYELFKVSFFAIKLCM